MGSRMGEIGGQEKIRMGKMRSRLRVNSVDNSEYLNELLNLMNVDT